MASLSCAGGQRAIARRDLRIALRAQVPDGGRILDQKREVVLSEQRQHARRVGADFFAHAGVEAIVDMGQRQVEMRLGFANVFDLSDPFRLLAPRQIGAKIEELRQSRRVLR